MCLAIPGKIKSIKDENAVIDFNGAIKEVNISLVESVNVGDYVIVHAGFAIQKLTTTDALDIFNLLNNGQKNK